ncbi:MAG: hypothetical protein KIS72_07145 [Luteimonas sp.]|nr:hypothetical protein [Luteimonas sp.]
MSLEVLEEKTAEFFERHWARSILGLPPKWKGWDTFLQGSVPNFRCGGCYAIFFESELAYIGLGASRGGGIYPSHGISRRLMAHVLRSDPEQGVGYSKLLDEWADATNIYTIGMPNTEYLAAALETYLIREISPPRNNRV